MAKFLRVCGAAALLMVSACGSSSPADKCRDLVDTVCDRVSDCLNASDQKAECVRAAGEGLDCRQATSVTDSFDVCMDQLEGATCDALLDADADSGDPIVVLPSSCRAVIQIGREGPPNTSFATSFAASFAGLRVP